jgi:trans-aconitate methyltransferase
MIGPFRRRAHFERDYISHVTKLLKRHSREEAMSLAVGGESFEEIGRAQVEQLIGAGLVDGMSVVDLGCGSGRTAIQIARRLPGVQYLGLDVVPALLAHARSISPANYRFVRSAALGFPVPDESVDMVFAYSVFTHLYHEESFAYLRPDPSARRPNAFLIPRVPSCQP